MNCWYLVMSSWYIISQIVGNSFYMYFFEMATMFINIGRVFKIIWANSLATTANDPSVAFLAGGATAPKAARAPTAALEDTASPTVASA